MPRPMNDTDVIVLEKSPDGNGNRLIVNGEDIRIRYTSHASADRQVIFGRDTIEGLIAESMAKEIAAQAGIDVPEERLVNLIKASK